MGRLIALVDDEKDVIDLISHHLLKSGFEVQGFKDAGSLYNFLGTKTPDLIILDLMLPDADGFEVCKILKKGDDFSAVPIIMLTAKGDESDRVLGLELGADDYVIKPFSPKELVARVKAVLRRSNEMAEDGKISVADGLEVDVLRHKVLVEGEVVGLTSTEFNILRLLASKKGWVFTREQILDHLWGHEKVVLDRTVDVHIRHLRHKLGKAARLVKNVRSVGYKLEE